MGFRSHIPDEAREHLEQLKDFYRKREKQKKEDYAEIGKEFNLADMPWRHNNKQFNKGYLILKALEYNTLVQDD